MDKPEPSRLGLSLREALKESGARPNGRYSTLSRYMLDHYDEVHALRVVERYSWSDIVVAMARLDEFSGPSGRALTVETVKLAWSRTNQRRRQDDAQRPDMSQQSHATPEPRPGDQSSLPAVQPRPVLQEAEVSLKARDDVSHDRKPEVVGIPPARLQEKRFEPSSPRAMLNSTTSILSKDEVERRLADLAVRQRGGKMPLPEIL